MISIYTLTSPLHDAASVQHVTGEFLHSLGIEYGFKDNDFSTYGEGGLQLIYVRTGGTEGLFKPLLPKLLEASRQPVYLLTSGKSNSLAASMEILSYLRQRGVKGEILHGRADFIRKRILELEKIEAARTFLSSMKFGVIGKPSDWLIASEADYGSVLSRTGIVIEDIPMEELLSEFEAVPQDPVAARLAFGESLFDSAEAVKGAAPDAYRLYVALRNIVSRHGLSGLTIRCFDLLSTVRNTGCYALARLNSEGIVSSCEGDVPALLSMAIAKAVTGRTGFQANPSSIDPETGEIVFAHCTVPLDMVTRYVADTHFESGIGVGIKGHIQEGHVTVFKVSGDLGRHFILEGELIRNQSKPDLCRTQIVVRLPETDYFLKDPIGNHHIIIPGHCRKALESIL